MFSFFEAAASAGQCQLEELVAGLPVTLEEFRDPSHRVAWDVWVLLCERFAARFDSEEALAATGVYGVNEVVSGNLARLVDLFVRPRDLFRIAYGWAAPSLYRSVRFAIVETAGGFQVSATLLPGYRPCRPWFVMFAGSVPLVPRFAGLPDAVVTAHTVTPTSALLEFQSAQAMKKSPWKRFATLFRASDAITAELVFQENQLADASRRVADAARSFENVLDALPGLVVLRGRNGEIRYANPSFATTCGVAARDLFGRQLEALIHVDDRAIYKEIGPGAPRPIRLSPGGDLPDRHLSVHFVPGVEFRDEHVDLLVGRDLTDEIAARGELLRSSQTLEALMLAHPDHVLRVDSTLRLLDVVPGRNTDINRELSVHIGRQLDEFVGPEKLFSSPSVLAAVAQVKEDLAAGRDFDVRFSFPISDGAERALRARGSPVQGDKEAIVIVSDETESLRAAKHVAEAERLASLGALAASVAHEINNPLTHVSASVQLLSEHLQKGVALDDEARDELLESIRIGAMRIGDAVARIQPLAKVDPSNEPAADIRSIVDEAIALLQNELRHRAPVDVHVATNRSAQIGRGELRTALLSVVMTVVRQLEADTSGSRDRRVKLSVVDDGPLVVIQVSSLDELDHPRATQSDRLRQHASPEQMGGMGLDLGIVSRITALAGGSFVVERDDAGGVLATIRLAALAPAAEVASGAESLSRPTLDAPTEKALVLIIDDDPLVLRVLVRALANFEVVGSTSAHTSAESLTSGAIDPAVILCDVMMPGMGGGEFHDLLKRKSPHLLPRLVFMTGGTFTGRSRDFVMRRDVRVVMKPLTLSEIRSVVESMVAKHRSQANATALPITPVR